MQTIYDFVSVACFVGLVLVYLLYTSREPKTLMYFLLSGICFAVANQLGNAGQQIFAVILLSAGVGFAAINVKT